jgi:PKHD-type hydroxylase
MQSVNLLSENDNLTNYYYFSNSFTDDEIEKIKGLSKKYSQISGTLGGGIVDPEYRRSTICWIPLTEESQFIYDKIFNFVKDANKKMWNFNVSTNRNQIQFGEYNSNNEGFYDWHMDIGSGSQSTRKISISVQLSDEDSYEGGNLEFMIHREIRLAPRKKASTIIFPSFFNHRVTKVTKGIRQSLVLWIDGPAYV